MPITDKKIRKEYLKTIEKDEIVFEITNYDEYTVDLKNYTEALEIKINSTEYNSFENRRNKLLCNPYLSEEEKTSFKNDMNAFHGSNSPTLYDIPVVVGEKIFNWVYLKEHINTTLSKSDKKFLNPITRKKHRKNEIIPAINIRQMIVNILNSWEEKANAKRSEAEAVASSNMGLFSTPRL